MVVVAWELLAASPRFPATGRAYEFPPEPFVTPAPSCFGRVRAFCRLPSYPKHVPKIGFQNTISHPGWGFAAGPGGRPGCVYGQYQEQFDAGAAKVFPSGAVTSESSLSIFASTTNEGM